MTRKLTFKYRLDENERRLLAAVADRMSRSRGDTIRHLIEIAAREFRLNPGDVPADLHHSQRETHG